MSVVLTWAGLAFPHQEGSWLVAGSQEQSVGLFPTNVFKKPPADQIALFSVLSQHHLGLHENFAQHFRGGRSLLHLQGVGPGHVVGRDEAFLPRHQRPGHPPFSISKDRTTL